MSLFFIVVSADFSGIILSMDKDKIESIIKKYFGNIDRLTKKQQELITEFFALADEAKIKQLRDNIDKSHG